MRRAGRMFRSDGTAAQLGEEAARLEYQLRDAKGRKAVGMVAEDLRDPGGVWLSLHGSHRWKAGRKKQFE